MGLPQNEVPLALLVFNIGVELGQLLFIAATLVIAWSLNKRRRQRPAWLRQVPACGVGGTAAFWLIERVTRC